MTSYVKPENSFGWEHVWVEPIFYTESSPSVSSHLVHSFRKPYSPWAYNRNFTLQYDKYTILFIWRWYLSNANFAHETGPSSNVSRLCRNKYQSSHAKINISLPHNEHINQIIMAIFINWFKFSTQDFVLSSLWKGTICYKIQDYNYCHIIITIIIVIKTGENISRWHTSPAAMRVVHPAARLKLPQVGTSHPILKVTSNKRQHRNEVTSWNCSMCSHTPHSACCHINTKSLILTILSCHILLSKKLLYETNICYMVSYTILIFTSPNILNYKRKYTLLKVEIS